MKSVSVITASIGNPILAKNIDSIRNQTHKNVQHIIVVDGNVEEVNKILSEKKFPCSDPLKEAVVYLPYSIGNNRWNAHRIYGATSYIAEGDYFVYLDEDNYLEPNHIENCLKVVESGKDWAFSFRKIVDKNGAHLCNDDCESLGKWPSVLHPEDYFVDVNCYFLPKMLAVQITPVWYRKFREPGQMEIDRAICHVLRQIAPNYDSTYNYTVNYTVGNSQLSVTSDFFMKGNAEMHLRFNGKLPWKKT